ncbi:MULTISPECIES: type 4a pilus biogenesis protein PilO [unclassified Photobacterium]|uniref:type 4a pilus biogenesis protein PilO n=1 Tax=unclassified Photobacterium TaxID=2628852 RepID=UPI000D17AE30|nr:MULTISPECIES: type 4a pilus biogenesis protein PilO [unclassified Photobacterium]PSV31644.1 MSHA biogenesis protein MshJ [Photobacterium sp. GB-72]PSV38997.1 MSHA biogenesis protein MshJ [Photobacterium sp. GB-210]PSV45532.1 MSHA biogenesis protein MshJ [Photobacterium sp. GB-36]PSV53007.1 MSHA biogenesis protein MshJ [Photobacterium sp. GB-1]PSV57593.1 MSHA biogenesis protein MshJ [Photobacterium sp. GB-3]
MIKWDELSQRFAALSVREQWLIAITGWFGILFIGYMLIIEPQMVTLQTVKTALVDTKNDVITAQNQLIVANRKLQQDPDKAINQKLAQYQQEDKALQQALEAKIGSLITPVQMAGLLEQVLRHSSALKLESMTSLPSSQLVSGDQQGYFVHPIRLTFKGRYFDVVNYLNKLEALPVKYYWRSLSYQVDKYPWAKVELEVYTLGESKDFIGG